MSESVTYSNVETYSCPSFFEAMRDAMIRGGIDSNRAYSTSKYINGCSSIQSSVPNNDASPADVQMIAYLLSSHSSVPNNDASPADVQMIAYLLSSHSLVPNNDASPADVQMIAYLLLAETEWAFLKGSNAINSGLFVYTAQLMCNSIMIFDATVYTPIRVVSKVEQAYLGDDAKPRLCINNLLAIATPDYTR
eukprot:gene12821-7464_t